MRKFSEKSPGGGTACMKEVPAGGGGGGGGETSYQFYLDVCVED